MTETPDTVGLAGRLAQARRLLAVALERDVTRNDASAMIGMPGPSWSRWESGELNPRPENKSAVVALFHRQGMPYITELWLDYGVGDIPRVVTEMVEVFPGIMPEVKPAGTLASVAKRQVKEEKAVTKKSAAKKTKRA